MQELRLVAVSEDGSYAVLVVPGRSGRFALPIDDRLRTVARGQFSRLAQFEIEVESPLRPKEIQDRIRAGETAEEIADAAGLPVDRIRRFEGPVLAEREYRATEAQRATVRGRSDSGPGPRLGDIVRVRLSEVGASVDDVEWDSRKRPDGAWQVQLAYTVAGRMHMAEWVYDPRSKHVMPDDDEAMRLCLDEADWPGPRPAPAAAATVTRIGSRTSWSGAHSEPRAVSHPSRQAQAPATAHARDPVSHHAPEPARGFGPSGSGVSPDGTVSPRDSTARGSGPSGSGPSGSGVSPDGTVPPRDNTARDPSPQADRGDKPATPGEEEAPPARPAKRASGGRPRRSSVPSWDEIMFGNSRQTD